jgi:hypothetical protein
MFAAQRSRMLRIVETLRRRISTRDYDDKMRRPMNDYQADAADRPPYPRYETK